MGTNGCLDLRRLAFALDEQVSAEGSRYPGSMARRARDNVARPWCSFFSTKLNRLDACEGRLSAGVGRRHPVTIRILSRWSHCCVSVHAVDSMQSLTCTNVPTATPLCCPRRHRKRCCANGAIGSFGSYKHELRVKSHCVIARVTVNPHLYPLRIWAGKRRLIDSLFRMTQLTNRNNTKSHHAKRKPVVSRHYNKWKYNGKITDQCQQGVSLRHIGLVKDYGGHLVNQPRVSLFDNCWKTTIVISTVRKTNKHTEHGEASL